MVGTWVGHKGFEAVGRGLRQGDAEEKAQEHVSQGMGGGGREGGRGGRG